MLKVCRSSEDFNLLINRKHIPLLIRSSQCNSFHFRFIRSFTDTTKNPTETSNFKPKNENKQVARNHWLNKYHQRNFFDNLGEELGIRNPNDWYRVKHQDVVSRGGHSVLRHFEDSLFVALQSLYPEVKFHPWLFDRTPRGYWLDIKVFDEHYQFLILSFRIKKCILIGFQIISNSKVGKIGTISQQKSS